MVSPIFGGSVFCSSGLTAEQVDSLRRKIEQLGGRYDGNLTRQTTHLLLERPFGSAKYQACMTGGKDSVTPHILLPTFVEDCWNRLHLGGLSMAEMLRRHQVLPLRGCKIALSGWPSADRAGLAARIHRLGGRYTCHLTSKGCTALLVPGSPEGTAKIVYALKWNVPIVDVRWLEDCEAAGHCVGIEGYSVTVDGCSPLLAMPEDVSIEEINEAASQIPPYLQSTHIYLDDAAKAPSTTYSFKDRLALLKRLILVAGGTRYSGNAILASSNTPLTHVIVHGQQLSEQRLQQLRQIPAICRPLVVHEGWLVACFLAKDRVPVEPYLVKIDEKDEEDDVEEQRKGNINQIATRRAAQSQETILSAKCLNLSKDEDDERLANDRKETIANKKTFPTTIHDKSSERMPLEEPIESDYKIFLGWSFWLIPSMSNSPVSSLLTKCGGELLKNQPLASQEVIIVGPLIFAKDALSNLSLQIVNEFWVEQCITDTCIYPPDQHYFRPLIVEGTVEALLEGVVACPTGLVGLERLWYQRLVCSLGGRWTEALTKKNTLLLVGGDESDDSPAWSLAKVQFAKRCGMKVVRAPWLIESIKHGCLLETTDWQLSIIECIHEAKVDHKNAQKATVAVDTPLRRDFAKRIQEASANTEPIISSPSSLLKHGREEIVESKPSQTILAGLHRREELHDLVVELGGSFIWTWDPSATHYLHQGNQAEETFREFRQVQAAIRECRQGNQPSQSKSRRAAVSVSAAQAIVSPWWLVRCKEAGRKLPEENFPHTYNPQNVTLGETENSLSNNCQSLSNTPSTLFDSLRLDLNQDDDLNGADNKNDGERKRRRRQPNIFAVSFEHEEKIEPILESPPSISIMLSSLTAVQRSNFATGMSKLPGCIMLGDGGGEDYKVDYLVVGTPSRTEKFLSAVSAGKWILRPSFCEASMKAGCLVDPDPHEWGIELATARKGVKEHSSKSALERAPARWRRKLSNQQPPCGAFTAWHVVLAVEKAKVTGFERILRAGKAASVYIFSETITSPLPPPEQTTHVLVSSVDRHGLPPDWIGRLAGKVEPIEWIAEYLLKE